MGIWKVKESPAATAAKSLQSCPTLCDPIDGSPPGSPVPGILQARTLGVGCHFLLQCIKVENEVTQSCLTLCDPMDCSPPGSSVHGIFQARVLEWGATLKSSQVNFHWSSLIRFQGFGIISLWVSQLCPLGFSLLPLDSQLHLLHQPSFFIITTVSNWVVLSVNFLPLDFRLPTC